MPEFTLQAIPALRNYEQQFNGVRLAEQSELAIVSLAIPSDQEAVVANTVEVGLEITLPPVGQSTVTRDAKMRLLGLAEDRFFIIFNLCENNLANITDHLLQGTAYTTDQTDAWVGLEIIGPRVREALERLCPLDLHPDVFSLNSATRTVMEHLGVIIVCTGTNDFLLLCPRSFASSFLHAVEISVQNVT